MLCMHHQFQFCPLCWSKIQFGDKSKIEDLKGDIKRKIKTLEESHFYSENNNVHPTAFIKIDKDNNGVLTTEYNNTTGEAAIKNEILEFVINDTSFRTELTMLMIGDPAQYKNPADFYKRSKQIWSPGTYLDTTVMDQHTYNVEYLPSTIRGNIKKDESKRIPKSASGKLYVSWQDFMNELDELGIDLETAASEFNLLPIF